MKKGGLALTHQDGGILTQLDKPFIGCTVVIEKNGFVSMGIITFIEGDVMEIEMSQYKQYGLGDHVKIVIYSTEGMLQLYTSVIAKETGFLILITPPKIQQKLLNKRQHPRVDVQGEGWIRSITDVVRKETIELTESAGITIHNVGIGGLGFTSTFPLQLKEKMLLSLQFQMDTDYFCTIEVAHVKKSEKGIYYGSIFKELPKDKANNLRAFILRQQVENRFKQKRAAQRVELRTGDTA
jgi:hypothetical protein